MALVLGVGMCLSMGKIVDGKTINMVIGIVTGLIGIVEVKINHPIYQKY